MQGHSVHSEDLRHEQKSIASTHMYEEPEWKMTPSSTCWYRHSSEISNLGLSGETTDLNTDQRNP
jgi:hypothetical protein